MEWDKDAKQFQVQPKANPKWDTEDLILTRRPQPLTFEGGDEEQLSLAARNLYEWLKEYQKKPY